MVLSNPIATAPVYASRPLISVDGQLNQDLSLGLITMLVQEDITGLYSCEVSFANWGPNVNGEVGTLYEERDVLDFGKEISIEVGDSDTAASIFTGRIMAFEGHYPQARPPEIIVLAEDRLQDLRMTRRTRTFEEVNDSDVINRIASEHGLTADVDLPDITYPVLTQVNQSDLAFIRERARILGAEVWLDGSTLYVKERQSRGETTIPLTWKQNLLEFSVMADIAKQRTSVAVNGWDVQAKEAISVEAEQSSISQELNGLSSGGQILDGAIGTRKESLVHRTPFTENEARHLAQAEYRKIARRFVTGNGMTDGDGRIKVGTIVDVIATGPMFRGEYYVTAVSHMFDVANGYRTAFRVERAGI